MLSRKPNKRPDSPRPTTPLNHFRTDLPTLSDGNEFIIRVR